MILCWSVDQYFWLIVSQCTVFLLCLPEVFHYSDSLRSFCHRPTSYLLSSSSFAFKIFTIKYFSKTHTFLLIMCPKYFSFNATVYPFNEQSELLSLRVFLADILDSSLRSSHTAGEPTIVFSSIIVQTRLRFVVQISLMSNCHVHTSSQRTP